MGKYTWDILTKLTTSWYLNRKFDTYPVRFAAHRLHNSEPWHRVLDAIRISLTFLWSYNPSGKKKCHDSRVGTTWAYYIPVPSADARIVKSVIKTKTERNASYTFVISLVIRVKLWWGNCRAQLIRYPFNLRIDQRSNKQRLTLSSGPNPRQA